jgi:p-aminobenzoyl-glutamate transporter AbgT
VLLVAVPVLILIGMYVTKKMIKAMTYPYSIEYLYTQKKLKKIIKQARKALKKMNIAVRKGYETSTTLVREQER